MQTQKQHHHINKPMIQPPPRLINNNNKGMMQQQPPPRLINTNKVIMQQPMNTIHNKPRIQINRPIVAPNPLRNPRAQHIHSYCTIKFKTTITSKYT